MRQSAWSAKRPARGRQAQEWTAPSAPKADDSSVPVTEGTGELRLAQQVEVTGGPEGLGRPNGDEHGALQDEPICVSRDRETIEQPLQGEARQDEIEILAALARDVEQKLADRRSSSVGDAPAFSSLAM